MNEPNAAARDHPACRGQPAQTPLFPGLGRADRRRADRRLARGQGAQREGPRDHDLLQVRREPRGREDQGQVQGRRHRPGDRHHLRPGFHPGAGEGPDGQGGRAPGDVEHPFLGGARPRHAWRPCPASGPFSRGPTSRSTPASPATRSRCSPAWRSPRSSPAACRASTSSSRRRRCGSLEVGAPIYFRQIRVGEVVALALAEDGSKVTAKIFVHAPYDRYVLTGTRFWNASGIDFRVDATGPHREHRVGGLDPVRRDRLRPGRPDEGARRAGRRGHALPALR